MRRLISTGLLAAILAFALPAYAGFVKGPYLQQVTKTGVTFMWESEAAAPGTVEWGTDESLGQSFQVTAGTMHEQRLDGLKPNTRYYYQVTSDGQTSNLYSFMTAPDAYTPFRFVAFGDSRSGYNEHRRVASAIMSEDPSIYLNSGDLVCNGPDELCWQEHFDIELELMATRFLLPAMGNHDKEGLDITQYRRYFSLPSNNVDAHQEQYYHVDWGNTRFVVLDDQVSPLSAGGVQYEWLLWVLQDAKDNPYIQHIFLMIHEGPYSAKPGRNGNQNLRNLMEAFAEYGVTAIFSGHDHHYYRGQSYNGVNFIVTGGGGASLYDCEPLADFGVRNIQCVKDYNYVVFEVDGAYLQATAKTADGQVIEEFEWYSQKELPDIPTDGDEPEDGDEPSDGDEPFVDGDIPSEDGDSPGFVPGGNSGATEYDPEFGFSGCSQTDAAPFAAVFALAALLTLALLRRQQIRVSRDKR